MSNKTPKLTDKQRRFIEEYCADCNATAPDAIKPSPWFLRMPVLHGPPQVLGLT